jgi:hypothetical protein
MKSITREQLDHLGDPVAQMVWRLWIKRGEAQLLESPAGNRKNKSNLSTEVIFLEQ